MKPIKLVIDGIRSFSERVEIDFESVSSSGLFGIFGSTGSGKSTILDSVIIALYGEISGLKAVELISARRKNAYISLEFEIFENSVRQRYLVERSFKLKKDGSYGGAVASLYQTTGGSVISLASLTSEVNKKIESILGLGQAEFTKCIILPQGEFAQFVKAPKGERVKIIEKLFGLEKYGDRFNIKLKAKIESVDRKLEVLYHDLSRYENDTKENLDALISQLKAYEKEYETKSEKLLKINEYIEENTPFYNLYNKCVEESETLELLKKRQVEIDALNGVLEVYDVAKRIVDLQEELDEKLKVEKVVLKEYSDLSLALSDLKIKREKSEEEYLAIDNLKLEKEDLKAKRDELISISAKIVEFKTLRKEVLTTERSVEEKKLKIKTLKTEIDKLTDKKIDLTHEIEYLITQTDVTKAFSFVSNSRLKNEYLNQVNYYLEQSKAIENFESDGECGLYFKNLIAKRLDEFKTLYEELCDGEEIDVNSVVENFKILLSQRNEKQSLLGAINGKIESVKNDVKDVESSLKESENSCRILREKLDALNVKLVKIVGNIDDYDSKLTFYSDCVNSIEKRENDIRENREKISREYATIEKQVFEKEVLKSTVTAEREKVDKLVEELFSDKISRVEDAKKIVENAVDVEKIKSDIENHKKSLVYYETSVEKTKRELEKVKFNLELYHEKIAEKTKLSQEVEILKENLIKYQNNVEILSQNFKNRCIIEKDIKEACARASVLARLEQVVSRRAFSEFISAEFLSDVALQARKTLLELTGGKYDVVYKDSIESGKDGFYICDNLNGGIEWSVASLSGGETFLVSLSLALALSVGIYSRSEKPMEFFFLDEGFGTLDETLVDTVLDSLEKLRNKNFSIGLISHLAEMKSRIDSKIIVTPATEISGSKVTIKSN